ncbi:jg23063 [Pararge aegeria aegeria]|uniref:Jg23063 protein n=1 Tax=Pararge aegeria aegeria TaxID=348720 RepID=A0A8S4SA96_9NEOP|nr:jg23063 [Pararge aegeria aegeria]
MWVPNLPVTILTGLTAGAGALCLIKDMNGGIAFDNSVSAEGKTVIVTGATSGIGKEAAWEFAQRGAKVFMACRDMTKCEEARREIVLGTNNKYVYCRPCDLASAASIQEFVARFKSEEPKVNILVNNAGVMESPQGVTREGFETQLGTNHFGHFLLTHLLLDTLKESTPSRVVIVSYVITVYHKMGNTGKDFQISAFRGCEMRRARGFFFVFRHNALHGIMSD